MPVFNDKESIVRGIRTPKMKAANQSITYGIQSGLGKVSNPAFKRGKQNIGSTSQDERKFYAKQGM